ncbi:hypothetical protein ACMGDH_06095 [Sphingomonas sp. DT-207]|uniref:hypothetical protein n=1 Tax=Sphingomonas sp. DT-207 TaxID=3396167 RepID=UPI003F1979CD
MTGPIRQEPRPAPPRLRPGYWFRPKRFGLGAVPASWQGWLLTLVVLVCGILLGRLAEQRGPIWLALLVPLFVGFIVLAWIKTDGEWRWRWGRDD